MRFFYKNATFFEKNLSISCPYPTIVLIMDSEQPMENLATFKLQLDRTTESAKRIQQYLIQLSEMIRQMEELTANLITLIQKRKGKL